MTPDTRQNLKWTVEARGGELELPGFNDELLRRGSHLMAPVAPLSLYPLIGAVALFWGGFEAKMDELLSSFIAADADPHDQGWTRRPFKKRKELLIEKARSRFPGRISEEIERILRAGATYHWQRNLLIHGHFTAHFKIGAVTITAEGLVHDRYVALPVTSEHLERMHHEIGILNGRLHDLTADRRAGKCWLSLRDRSTLRAFVAKHPWTPPTAQRIQPQHPPLKELSLLHRLPKWRRPKLKPPP
jgi:hypothetical protein